MRLVSSVGFWYNGGAALFQTGNREEVGTWISSPISLCRSQQGFSAITSASGLTGTTKDSKHSPWQKRPLEEIVPLRGVAFLRWEVEILTSFSAKLIIAYPARFWQGPISPPLPHIGTAYQIVQTDVEKVGDGHQTRNPIPSSAAISFCVISRSFLNNRIRS